MKPRTVANLALVSLPILVAIAEISATHRLLDAPFGYLGTLYHHLPGWHRLAIVGVPFGLIVILAKIGEIGLDGKRIGYTGLVLLALVALWQVVPSTVARHTGEPATETAEIAGVSFNKSRDETHPFRLILRRPGGALESISAPEGEALASAIKPGDRVSLEGRRSAFGFFVLRIGKPGA